MNTATIVSIAPVGVKKVFDLEVAGHHNYIANGVLVHNCSYHDILDHYGKKYNEEFYKVKDTFVTYKHRRLLFYPAGPNKKTLRGRCLIGSTLINTGYGFIRLNELITEDGQVGAEIKVDTNSGEQQATHTYRDTANSTIKVTTTNGYTLQGTPEHPVYVLMADGTYDWCKLEDITPGLAIMSVSPIQNPTWSDISDMSEYMMALLVENIDKVGEYPIEMRTASKSANTTFIDMLFAKYATFTSHHLHLKLNKTILSDLHVMLLHGFGIVAKLDSELCVPYQKLKNIDLTRTRHIIGARYPTQFDDEKLHHEFVAQVDHSDEACQVYDLTVPQGHAFMANGMVSHNTRVLCLAEGSLVSTARGLVPIESVVPGDTVYKGSSPRSVVASMHSGTKTVYTVTLDNGLQLKSTKDHKFRVVDKNLKESWVQAIALTHEHYVQVSLGGDFPQNNVIHASENGSVWVLDETIARLLAKLKHSIVAGKIVESANLSACLTDAFPLIPEGSPLPYHVFKVLTDFGFNTDTVPDSILVSPKEVVRAYLKECFLTSEYLTIRENTNAIRTLLLKFGIVGKSQRGNITLNRYEYCLLHGIDFHPESSDLEQYQIPNTWSIHRPVYVESKMNRNLAAYMLEVDSLDAFIDKGIVFCRFHSLLSDGYSVPTYDITVDAEDHTFTANGMVVHNSAIDEIGWFDNQNDGKVKMDATQVYVALDRSLLTVRASARRLIAQGFDDIPNGFAFNVSSPSSARDKIVELVAQSKNSRKIFGFKRATWDMNPHITKDDLSEEYAKNPIDAERDYACNPPLSDNAFIPNFSTIEGCFIGRPNKVRYKHAQKKSKDGTVTRYAVIDEISKSTKANVIGIDAGYSNNSFSAVCAHMHEGLPIVNCAIEVMPNPGMPLNHALIFREALHTMIKERNVKLLLADRWQSIKLLQDAELEFEGLLADQYSLRYDDFWILKQTMFDSEVIFPKLTRPIEEILKFDQSKYPYCLPDPIEHLAVQCVTVRDMGNSIDKGDGLTDDVFRAACLAVWGLQSDKYAELFDDEYGEEESIKAGALGYMAGRSGSMGTTGREVHVTKQGKAIGVMSSKR